ncbi:uncharacterized protein LOC133850390 [Drosophila sulfurigaster albostrigata]|uniref:uncharacterized protein LOC133850390 n=1 Tax=Drosophila sulfurigaster albostrigata TaxID=89887 RepID=UPI002D219F36|nr:uncharacterized protein LOC133850390 [Drosophila sulfurigaster albostrigata]
MPRTKPTTTLDVLGNLDLKPEEAVGDYLLSKAQQKYFVKPPNADAAGDSIELMYIHNSREHEMMLRLQQDMLENCKQQSSINSERVKEMYKTQEHLRQRFIDVNSFIKDCSDKKRIAEKAINDETQLHQELSEDIKKFKTSIDELTTFREALKATVEELQPYEKVLDEVVEVSDIFVSPKDCMDRCDALMLAQVEINDLEVKKLREIEEMRQHMVKITSEAALTVLGLKNDLSVMERSYNESRAQCLKWEKILEATKDVIAARYLEKQRNMNAIHSLYFMLCRRRDISPHIRRRNMEKVLDFIKGELYLLQEILMELEKPEAKF